MKTTTMSTPVLQFDGTYVHATDGTRYLAVCADKGKHLGQVFAAAPDLLAAAKVALAYFDKAAPESGRAIALRLAIQRATA